MLQAIDIKGVGFNILKDYNSWRIANLGYDENSNSITGIKNLGRHLETIEVFILIEGTASMVIAGYENSPTELTIEKLEPGKLYVVQERQWHGALLEPDSILLIMENQNTNATNSENYTLTKEDKETIKLSLIGEKTNVIK